MSKTELSKDDIKKIIDLYQSTIPSTHKLAEHFKVGHKKVTKILRNNNININKLGAQGKNEKSKIITKNKTLIYSGGDKNLVAVCKKTKKEFNDANNLSGILTNYILKTYPNVTIPLNNYQRKKYEESHNKKWFEEYFDIIEKEIPNVRKCGVCGWDTSDVVNKTGCFENHIKDVHKIFLTDYLKSFPDEIIFHKKYLNKIQYDEFLLDGKNYVICKLCGEKMKVISNTHLKIGIM